MYQPMRLSMAGLGALLAVWSSAKYLPLSGNSGGCYGHPDVAGQQLMADSLIAALHADLGW
jgi:hypothetical protein